MSRGGKQVGKPGRPAKLGVEHEESLRAVVKERPVCSLEELRQAFIASTGIEVSIPTLRKALHAARIKRVMPERGGSQQPEAARAVPPVRRYGYRAAHRDGGDKERYPSSLTDAEWALSADLFESDKPTRGLPPRYARRAIVEACCYVVRTGCAWRQLPKDLPPWQAVYKSFTRWVAKGRFEAMHDRLREQWRARVGRDAGPSAAVLDAQSTRISPQGGQSGFDAGKKVKGRKRNLVVDTLGLVLAVVVTAASVQDRDGAMPAMQAACAKYPSLTKLYVDGAYGGACAQTLHAAHQLDVEVVRHPANRNVGRWQDLQLGLFESPHSAGFVPLPKRWVVERTHAWNERARRLIMHHDRNPAISESWVWLAEARLLSRRLTGIEV